MQNLLKQLIFSLLFLQKKKMFCDRIDFLGAGEGKGLAAAYGATGKALCLLAGEVDRGGEDVCLGVYRLFRDLFALLYAQY